MRSKWTFDPHSWSQLISEKASEIIWRIGVDVGNVDKNNFACEKQNSKCENKEEKSKMKEGYRWF